MISQKTFFVSIKTFFIQFKKWLFPFFIVALLVTTIIFGLLDLQRQKVSHDFTPQQQTIVIRCGESTKNCTANNEKLPFQLNHFFQSLVKTWFIDINSISTINSESLSKIWRNKYQIIPNKAIKFQAFDSVVKIRSLMKDNKRVGYTLTLLNGVINERNWFLFSKFIANEKSIANVVFKQIFNANPIFVQKKITKTNYFFNRIDYRLLIFILIFAAFGLFMVGMLFYFGASWGFFNILFNVAFFALVLLIFNHFGFILSFQNLILLFVTWIVTIYWQFQIMRQSQNFIPQKTFFKLISFNLKSIQKTTIIFCVLTIGFLAYFLLIYPESSKKIILPSLNINQFSETPFAISVPLLILWVSLIVGILFFQSIIFIAFYSWQPFYQKLFPVYTTKIPTKPLSLLELSKPKSLEINSKTRLLTTIGLFLAIIAFGTLIPFLARNVISDHILVRTNFDFENLKYQLQPVDFFIKWKLYLIVLLLTFVFLWFFTLIFFDKYSTLWFTIETLFMSAFYFIMPITILIAFQPILGGGFSETLMLFCWILIIKEFVQIILNLFSQKPNQPLTFRNVFVNNCRTSSVEIGLILLLFSFLLKSHLWLYCYFIATFLIREIYKIFIRHSYLKIFSFWKQNQEIKHKKMYIEYKKQSFLEREIEGIND